MSDELLDVSKITLRKAIDRDKAEIVKKLISGGLTDEAKILYSDFLKMLNVYIEICEYRGRF